MARTNFLKQDKKLGKFTSSLRTRPGKKFQRPRQGQFSTPPQLVFAYDGAPPVQSTMARLFLIYGVDNDDFLHQADFLNEYWVYLSINFIKI